VLNGKRVDIQEACCGVIHRQVVIQQAWDPIAEGGGGGFKIRFKTSTVNILVSGQQISESSHSSVGQHVYRTGVTHAFTSGQQYCLAEQVPSVVGLGFRFRLGLGLGCGLGVSIREHVTTHVSKSNQENSYAPFFGGGGEMEQNRSISR
jgi:hypothetical protein